MQCFVCGLLSLIPGIGILFAVAAFFRARQATRSATGAWNPAGHYLVWGRRVASLGILISFAMTACFCFIITVGPSLDFGVHSGGT